MHTCLFCVYRGVKVYALTPEVGPVLYRAGGRGVSATAIDIDMLRSIIDAALYVSVLTRRDSIHAVQ